MDTDNNQSPAYHLESLIDKRLSTASFKNKAYWLMDQTVGWCSHSKSSILLDIIQKTKPQVIVEIGVFGGKSLIPMAYALKIQGSGIIYGIDPWSNQESIQGMQSQANINFWEKIDLEWIYQSLVKTIDRFALNAQVRLLRTTSANASPITNIDLLHIDGNHSQETSFIDVTKWVPLVKPGGWIIVDDLSWFENGSYTQGPSIKWLDENCFRMAEIQDFSTWGIWVKK